MIKVNLLFLIKYNVCIYSVVVVGWKEEEDILASSGCRGEPVWRCRRGWRGGTNMVVLGGLRKGPVLVVVWEDGGG